MSPAHKKVNWHADPVERAFYRALLVDVRRRREAAKISQREAAEFLGITRGAYASMEGHRLRISTFQFARMCHLLGHVWTVRKWPAKSTLRRKA